MKKTVLRSYAKLIAACGVNIQKGQEVFIQAELDQPEFVTMLVEECYKSEGRRSSSTGAISRSTSFTCATAA